MDLSKLTPQQMSTLRKVFHSLNRLIVFMWKIGLGKAINMWPAGIGRIMVIRHRGRKSGKEYLTPVNYATVDGDFYSMVGFGSGSDWYRNILVSPRVQLWLPGGRHTACGKDTSDSPRRVFLLRQVLLASGFAAPMFGINPRKLSDEQLATISTAYHLVHFRLEKP